MSKHFTLVILLVSLFTVSCNSRIKHLFGKKTPRERYEQKMDELDLDETPEGREWKAVSVRSLAEPVSMTVPFNIRGQFPVGKPRALGFEFRAKRGEKIDFQLTKDTPALVIYADVFVAGGGEPLVSAEVDSSRFSFEAEETETYILRLQPQLQQAGFYRLSVSSGPSLGFPVGHRSARVGSFWGDDRDGGRRKHEGIDIFAPKRAPAVAAADGYVTSVGDGGLGGKTVWLRPEGKNYSLYYAHLDEQLVHVGQYVKKGEVLGLVGNTGNARTTPPHLHFGIYSYGGATDPLPFVNPNTRTAAAPDARPIPAAVRLTKSQKTEQGALVHANTLLVPLALSAQGYLAELPDGKIISAAFGAVRTLSQSTGVPVAGKNKTATRRS